MGMDRGFWGVRDEILYKRKTLPVWAVVARSYGYVWRNRGLLAPPLGLLLASLLIIGLIAWGVKMATADQPPYVQLPITLFWSMPILALITSFSVGLHRAVLLDEIREGIAFMRWDGYWWNYVKACLIALLVGIILVLGFTAALVLPLGGVNALALLMLHRLEAYGFFFLIFLVALFLWIKVGLAFPAAAMGYRYVFSLSWRLTDGNLLRLFAALLLVHLPFALPGLVLLPWMRTGIGGLLWAGIAVLAVISLAVLTVAVSLSFFFLFKASDEFGED